MYGVFWWDDALRLAEGMAAKTGRRWRVRRDPRTTVWLVAEVGA